MKVTSLPPPYEMPSTGARTTNSPSLYSTGASSKIRHLYWAVCVVLTHSLNRSMCWTSSPSMSE
eukprot:4378713-Prymnesium_polylepis.2